MIRHATSAVALSLSLAACAAPAPPMSEPPPPMAAQCNAEGGKWAIGRAAEADVLERLKVDTHSAVVRVLRPGMVVTMEYRGDRLDVRVNERGAIIALSCG